MYLVSEVEDQGLSGLRGPGVPVCSQRVSEVELEDSSTSSTLVLSK